MTDYTSKVDNLLTVLEKENKQLELDFKKKKCEHDEFWCDVDKKCKKKDRGGDPHGGINEGHDFAMYDKLKSELLTKLQMSGVPAQDGGGNRIAIGRVIVRIEGIVDDKPAIGGATGTKLSFD
tara:strand:+ start:2004 stop:2372 length:369 start_codon:yes stop_codon:yes gene_type:complete